MFGENFTKNFLKETPLEALFKSMDKDRDGFVTKEVISEKLLCKGKGQILLCGFCP